MFFFGNSPVKLLILFSMPGIDAIITDHLEVFFRNMLDEPFNECKGWDCFVDQDIIFMPVVMEGNKFSIISIDA